MPATDAMSAIDASGASGASDIAPVQLFCLAHAGGTAGAYRQWGQHLPRDIQIVPLELPGHGTLRGLPPHVEWASLIDSLCNAFYAARDHARPYAVFGHSMGALVGLELLYAVRQQRAAQENASRIKGATGKTGTMTAVTESETDPVWFGVSGSVGPSRRRHETHWLHCTTAQMIDKLRALGGTPAALLDDPDFISMLMPTLRADFHLCGTYRDRANDRLAGARVPLACPIAVFTGRDDPATACDDDLACWQDETRGPCTFHRFDGGHFYLDDARGALLARVAASLADARARRQAAALAMSQKRETGTAWTL